MYIVKLVVAYKVRNFIENMFSYNKKSSSY